MDARHIPDAAIDVIQREDALKKVSMTRTQHTTAYRKKRLHLWIHQIPSNFEELGCNCVEVSNALVLLNFLILNESKKCECVTMCMS